MTKREVADELVARLARGEDRYQALTLDLMHAAATFRDFGNLRQQEDSQRLVSTAREAQSSLKEWVEAHGEYEVRKSGWPPSWRLEP